MILFKNNYVEDEKLFSTGDPELDDILEEVYYSGISDGYGYFQKEFVKKVGYVNVKNAKQRVKRNIHNQKFTKKITSIREGKKTMLKGWVHGEKSMIAAGTIDPRETAKFRITTSGAERSVLRGSNRWRNSPEVIKANQDARFLSEAGELLKKHKKL